MTGLATGDLRLTTGDLRLATGDLRLTTVLHLSADDRVRHAHGGNLIFGDRHDVLREDRDVGELAGRQRALDGLLEPGVGRADGVGPQRFQAAHALAWIEDTPVLQLARNGRVEARNGIDVFDGRVGAVGD